MVGLVAVMVFGFAMALPPIRDPASSPQATHARAASAPPVLDCSPTSSATLSILSPASSSGLAGTEIEFSGTGFYSQGGSGFVVIFLVNPSGSQVNLVVSVYGVTSAPFKAYLTFPAETNGTSNTPGEYTFWASNGFQPATCASTTFTVTGTPPSALACLNYFTKLIVTSPASASGSAGSSVTVQGQTFYYVGDTTLVFSTLDGTTYTSLATVVPSSPYGWFNVTVTVPSGYAPGTYLFWAVDSLENCGGAFFTLTAAATGLTLNPTVGPPGSVVTATGTGFAPDSTIEFSLDSEFAASDCSSDATGAFPGITGTPCTFVVPEAPNGNEGGQNVVAVDQFLGRGTASFDVTPEITLTPNQGPLGATFTVNGSGFSASPSGAVVNFAGSELSMIGGSDCMFNGPEITLDVNGGFSCTSTVPSWAATGPNVVQGDDLASGELTAAQTFIAGTLPLIAMTPGQGLVGSTFTIIGSSFSVGGVVYLTLNTVPYSYGDVPGVILVPSACTRGTVTGSAVTTGPHGGFQCTFTIPATLDDGTPVVPGIYYVAGLDTTTDLVPPNLVFTVT